MSERSPGGARRPRLSFTRKHTESGVVAELLTLLETVTADGTIVEAEAREMLAWLDENRDQSSIPGIEFLRTTVREILSDGKVTDEERTALYKAVEKVLPPEARRAARERRSAIDALEKVRARAERAEQKQLSREERERNRPVTGANFMVAGVLYEGRAAIVERFATVGQQVFLLRQPDNPHDPNAILVRLPSGYDIGYVPRADAAALARFLDLGFPHSANITKILQGRRAPIPVVDADIYRKDTDVEKSSQSDVPQTVQSNAAPATGVAQPCGCVAAILGLLVSGTFLAVLIVFGLGY